MADNIKQILNVPEPTEEQKATNFEEYVGQPVSDEEMEKMGYMRKKPIFIGTTDAFMDFGPIINFIQREFVDVYPNVMPIILDVPTAKQVEKYVFSKTKELNKIVEFQSLRSNPENVQQILSAAMRLKSLLGSKPFRLKQCVEKTKHTYKNASDLLTLMFVMGFVVRWKVEGEWNYQIISNQADFEAFARRRVEEAAQQIWELEQYIDQLRALAIPPNNQEIINQALAPAQEAEVEEVIPALELAKPKKPRKKKVPPVTPGEE